jgi:hypothetical protein
MPLYKEMGLRDSIFTHLVPYPEKLQGEPWCNISSSLSSISTCEKIILAGGGFTAWSEAVLSYANQLGIPVYLSELAYGSFSKKPNGIHIDKVSVLTPVSKTIVCETLSIRSENVFVTGSPQVLCNLEQKGDTVLLLSTSDLITRDPSANLIKIANYLRNNSIPYLVRTHPREDQSIWDGFPLSTTPLLSGDLSKAKMVVAYTGTPSLNVVASGLPLINLAPNDNFTSIIPPNYNVILPNLARNFDEVIALLNNNVIPSKSLVDSLLGNNDKAAKNIVDFWEST